MIKKLLLVEDDPITQMLERIILSNAKFCQEAISLDNGVAATEWLDQFLEKKELQLLLPELIFLDLNMPLMDGWEFLKIFEVKYSSFLPSTKIIILSSTINSLDWEKSKEHSLVIGFEKKPLSIDALERLKKSIELSHYFIDTNQ
jgi:CheY-like chemotaxis protein